MPSKRPRAAFESISADLDVDALVENTPNFQYADRISCETIEQQGMEAFDRLILLHVIIGGKPLIVDGFEKYLDPWTFSAKWLQDNHGEKVETARDLRKDQFNTPMTIGHYLRNMGKLAEQFFDKPEAHKDPARQRVYLKDIDCPDVWQDKLRETLPPNLFYLNDCSGVLGGPGSVDENVPAGGKRKGKGIAGAGDLMSSLPPSMRADNLMCYIGHEGTYTPAHREMCATMGHNIMVGTSDVVGDDGRPERPGSSIWFMTESKDRKTVSEYWLSILGHDIEVEKHFAQIAAWKNAPFVTYIVEQRVGDFILIPPMAPHQVWNRGTRTMKVAWNRTTVETLDLAFKEALPNARLVCRDEQYKNKAIVYYTLQKYSTLLSRARDQEQTAPSPQEAGAFRSSPKIRQLQKDFKRLLGMFKQILLSEMFSPETPHERNVEFSPFDSNITCAYCRGNIFNRFLTCKTCDDQLGTTDPEPYDVCMECYAMGRSCACISKMRWAQQFKWKELVQMYELWRKQYLDLDGGVRKSGTPLPLQEERELLTKKTLAQICQEQLKRRPWVDVHKKQELKDDEQSSEEIEINDDGIVKKKKKKRTEAWLKNHHACHVCCHRHEKWKMANCSCGRHWCYGTLFRGFDQMPQVIMADPDWKCPHCLGVCFAGACRKDPRQNPYKPQGTLLGHDTRRVADARSVESLVDFAVSNLTFLGEKVDAPVDSDRLRQRQEEAEQAKIAEGFDQQYVSDGDEARAGINYSPDETLIDPTLGGAEQSQIDPSLRGPSNATLPRPRGNHSLASLLNSDLDDDQDRFGYQPAQSNVFVGPSALMLQADFDDEEVESSYGPTGLESRKRRRGSAGDDGIKRVPAKKARRSEGDALPGASKQYRKEQERQALETARKNGRFIQMQAALRGRTKMVTLKLGRDVLAKFIADNEGMKATSQNDLLKSDVAPPEQVDKATTSASKPTKAVRVRVERDDDFDSRMRKRYRKSGQGIAAGGKKAAEKHFEEFDIDSEFDENDADIIHDGALETTVSGAKKRRASAWQAKRGGDDDEEPVALPNDYRERGIKPRPGPAQRKPAGKTVSLRVPDKGVLQTSGTSHSHIAAAALAHPQANGGNSAEGSDEEEQDSENDEEEDSDEDMGVKAVATSFPSLSSRTGKRTVKIVGSSSRNMGGK